MTVTYGAIQNAFAGTGLVVRGGFKAQADDDVPGDVVILIGNTGPQMWSRFSVARKAVSDPLDTWTRSIVAPRADALGARTTYPNDQPYRPFQQWAMRAEAVHPSPLGILIHPDYGLWHAYRAALFFNGAVEGLPPVTARPSPCASCRDKPCLTACPVGAFTSAGYDVPRCVAHLRTDDSQLCHDHGCQARLACPVAPDQRTPPAQRAFHAAAFFRSNG